MKIFKAKLRRIVCVAVCVFFLVGCGFSGDKAKEIKLNEEGLYKLSSEEREVYDGLKILLDEVASPNSQSHQARFFLREQDYDLLQKYGSDKEIIKSSMKKITECIARNYPEEFFWYSICQPPFFHLTNRFEDNSLEIIIYVDEAYQDLNANEEERDFTLDIAKLQLEMQSIRNAEEIAQSIRNKKISPMEKLDLIKDTICSMTVYNRDIINDVMTKASYSSIPWQIQGIFDGDDETNAICEGYAKSFQFLFDRVFAGEENMSCVCVKGNANGVYHIWNVVRIDGRGYLVDLTNCDDMGEAKASPGQLISKDGTYNSVNSVCGDGLFMITEGTNGKKNVEVVSKMDKGKHVYSVTTPDVSHNGKVYEGFTLNYCFDDPLFEFETIKLR